MFAMVKEKLASETTRQSDFGKSRNLGNLIEKRQ